MAFQLGHVLDSRLRQRSETEVVECAKRFLDTMDFIGFYEDWPVDYYSLRSRIFETYEATADGSNTWWVQMLRPLRRWEFYFGTLVGRLRLKTRKYKSAVMDEQV